jgi:ATP-binding cassette subfamily B protein
MNKTEQTTAVAAAYIGDIPNTPFGFLLYVSKPYKWVALSALLLVTIASAMSVGTSYFFKLIVDAAEYGNMDDAFLYALMYPVAIFLIQLLFRGSGVLGMIWVTGSKKVASDQLSDYLIEHSHKYFSDRFAGSLLSKVGYATGAIEQLIPEFLWTYATAIVSFIVTAYFIFNADALSGALFMLLTVVLIFTNRLFLPQKRILSRENSVKGTKLRGVIVDVLTNISATRQYVRSHYEKDNIHGASLLWRTSSRSNWAFTEKMLLLNTVVIFAFSFGMFYLLAQRWHEASITTGDFIFILAMYAQITGTLMFIGRAFNNAARSLGEMDEGLSDILQAHEITNIPNATVLTTKKGQIDWKEVTFEFGNNTVFDEFMLSIEPGQRVGLVGPSGAGKTTFVSLLLRQHEIHGGAIEIDGQNIAEVTQDSLRANIAVVPQEPLLFHRTVKENIAYGNPDATQEEIEEVAKKAQAHEFIMKLELGYDTMVGERGIKLSGGQKQRVAIARAMLKDAPILVLDEATSALDSESEVEIQKALHILMEGKTVIAVAHRLSTLREMDRILVLETGKIVEDGTHNELSQSGGTYQKLWEHQAGGFLTQ